MAIRFKYRIPENLQPLVDKTIVNYGLNYLYCIMPEGIVSQLRHCSLYMICEFEYINGTQVWSKPMGVVAHNEVEAMEAYVRETQKENGAVLCEVVNRCDNIKVEPY